MQDALEAEVFRDLRSEFEDDHVPTSNHVFILIKKIILAYIKIRFHHIAKESTLKAMPITIRSKLTKLVTFSGN